MDRLLVLTLALEESILSGDWQGATSLLGARDAALDRLSQNDQQSQVIDQVLAAEARCVALLAEQRRELASSWQEGRLGRQWASMAGESQASATYE